MAWPLSFNTNLRHGFLAGQVGKLVEIFLNMFSRAHQGIERWGSVGCAISPGGALGGASAAAHGERGNERTRHDHHFAPTQFRASSRDRGMIPLICEAFLQTGIRT